MTQYILIITVIEQAAVWHLSFIDNSKLLQHRVPVIFLHHLQWLILVNLLILNIIPFAISYHITTASFMADILTFVNAILLNIPIYCTPFSYQSINIICSFFNQIESTFNYHL